MLWLEAVRHIDCTDDELKFLRKREEESKRLLQYLGELRVTYLRDEEKVLARIDELAKETGRALKMMAEKYGLERAHYRPEIGRFEVEDDDERASADPE